MDVLQEITYNKEAMKKKVILSYYSEDGEKSDGTTLDYFVRTKRIISIYSIKNYLV